MTRRTVAALALLWAAAQPTPVQSQEAAWKPFQELNFLVGSWSGNAESGGRVGGRVARCSVEMSGHYLVQRSNTIFPAQAGQPEESNEEIGYFFYDREKRKYLAHFYYSTAIAGIYDVEFPAEGSVRLVSSQLYNYDPGARLRMTMVKKGDELQYQLEVAQSGKDFVSYVTSKLSKK